MGYLVEISESKVSKMSEYAEDALHAMGRLMSCISSLENGGYGERSEGRYGNRYGGGDMGYRHDDEEMRMGMRGRSMGYREMDDDDEDFGERRGRRRRDSMGRYR
jgi:hypothetical protein